MDRKNIIQKIAALQAKTVENGCTEEEALAAADMVGRLLDKYGLSMSDIEIKERDDITLGRTEARRGDPLRWALNALAAFYDVEVWQNDNRFEFLGFPEDVQAVLWLAGVLRDTCERDLKRYKKEDVRAIAMSLAGKGRTVGHSFRTGFFVRVGERLAELKAERDAANESTGRELVVVKGAVVKQKMADAGIQTQSRKISTRSQDTEAYGRGREAGSRAHLGGHLGGNSQGQISS
jgi:hypothetical protein